MRNVPWEDIFKLGASAATGEFCEWVQVETDVYIPPRKYQVKPCSSSCFSAACLAAIKITYFVFTNSISKAQNHCSRVLEAAKLAYANKKIVSLLRNMTPKTFGELPSLCKDKSSMPPLFNDPEVLSSSFDNAEL